MPITSFTCPKCATPFDVVLSTPTPDPTPNPIPTPKPDPRPVFAYTPNGQDDTGPLQDWIDAQPDNAIYDIRGMAAINGAGLVVGGKTNVTITSSNGGGFQAIADSYFSAFCAIVYAPQNNGLTFEDLLIDCNGKSAGGPFLHKSTGCKVLRTEVKNIRYVPKDGPPYAGIKGDVCTDMEVGFCKVHDLDQGPMEIRGIWLGTGENEHDVRPYIHDCVVTNSGHTGIVVEGSGPRVENNVVTGCYGGGSGYKFIARGDDAIAVFDNNVVDRIANGGFMIEGAPGRPPKIYIRNWKASNVGRDGTTFGFLYVAGDEGVANIEMSGCKLDNCKRIANILYLSDSRFSDVIATNGEAIVECIESVQNVSLVNAGDVSIGNNVSNVWVDGTKRA